MAGPINGQEPSCTVQRTSNPQDSSPRRTDAGLQEERVHEKGKTATNRIAEDPAEPEIRRHLVPTVLKEAAPVGHHTNVAER